MSLKLKDICMRYFKVHKDDSSLWKCKCGKSLKQRSGTGWTNLFNHIKADHAGWDQLATAQTTMDTFVCAPNVPASVTNMRNWLEWICVGLKPFTFVEDPLTRKFTNLAPTSVKTLKKYMALLVTKVESIVSTNLP